MIRRFRGAARAARALPLLALACLSACGDDPARDRAEREQEDMSCARLPSIAELRDYVRSAPDSVEAGGLFHGQHQWAAVVDRRGRICAVVEADDTAGASWPGSRSIAMAKAYTANAFSTDAAPLSTARLYSMAQPGGALYGAAAGNPFDPECLDRRRGMGQVCGGTIVFGGGLPLYSELGQVVGGLGVSGDTPCADHEVAKVIRALAGLTPPGGNHVDDIVYAVDEPPSTYTHPLCDNTYRNGVALGEAPPHPSYGRVPPQPPATPAGDTIAPLDSVARPDTIVPVSTRLDTTRAR